MLAPDHQLTSPLFVLNKKKTDTEQDQKEQDSQESTLPGWIKGLRRWPLNPMQQSPSLLQVTRAEQELVRDVLADSSLRNVTEGNPQQIPLTNLINVEALLMASGEKTLEQDDEQLALFELDWNKFAEQQALQTPSNVSSSPLSFWSNLQEVGSWNSVVASLSKSIAELADTATTSSSKATDALLKEMTSRIDTVVSEVSTAISQQKVRDLIERAGKLLNVTEASPSDLVKLAEQMAPERGLDVGKAVDRAIETTRFTRGFVAMANALLVAGYAREDTEGKSRITSGAVPLFESFKSARLLPSKERSVFMDKVAEMGSLCGAIYQETLPRTHLLGHSFVANGTSSNVAWMVTDSIDYGDKENSSDPVLVRTITIRGFDAADENVDREQLLVDICTASPDDFGKGIFLHSGLLKLARQVYADIIPYIDNTSPKHKIVVNGHSVGGSISMLILLLLTQERGSDFAGKRISQVYTFGSPPIAMVDDCFAPEEDDMDEVQRPSALAGKSRLSYSCDVLERLGLPSEMVIGFNQPWDPIVRLFTDYDPLYPLLGDLGKDGNTLYASGPPRTLRPLTRAIVESWEGWPRFRDSFRATVNQSYESIGVQHLLLPEPIRYISDRLVAVNVQIPPVDSVLRISADELLPALDAIFPLDVFQISFVPVTIRSFVHHFYPAYGFPIVEFTERPERSSLPDREGK